MRLPLIGYLLARCALFAAVTVYFSVIGVQAQGASFGPMRPANPADSIAYPPDTGDCESGPDRAMNLVLGVVHQCQKEFLDNRTDYAWIIAHVLGEFWVPGAGEWVMGELTTKLGKDATVCVLTGLVEGGGGSSRAQALAKAAIKEFREVSDRQKYYDKANKAWAGFSQYGREYVLTHKDHAKFLTYLDKKTFDRLKSTAKEASLVSALINYQDPTYKARTLVPEARDALNACSLTKAAASIQAAEEIQLVWLRQVRGDISRLKQGLRCLKEEHDRTQSAAPSGASLAHAQASQAFIEQRDTAKFNIEQLLKLDAEQVAALRQSADIKADIENRARIIDETLRKPFNAVKARAEQAFASCDYVGAEAHIRELQRYTRNGQCQGELKSEYYRELELQNELQARRAKRAEDESVIARRFSDAMSKGGSGDCIVFGEEAGYLTLLTKNVCVDQAAVRDKIGKLQDAARACEAAKNGANAAAAGNAVLTMQEPVLDDKKYWAGVWDHNAGNSRGEYYPGEYLAASTHTWTAPQTNVGPQGFQVTLTVKCETGPKQGGGLDTSTWIKVKGFQIVKSAADPTPIKEEDARAHVTCPRGGAGSDTKKTSVWVLPFPRYDEGAEAWIKIGGGPGVKYPYIARKPNP